MLLLIECVIACLIFHVLVYRSVTKNPLAWIGSYPPAIAQRVRELGILPPERKERDRRKELLSQLTTYVLFVVLGVIVIFWINHVRTFVGGFLHMFAILMSITWYDALVVDILWFRNSQKVRIKGTEDMVDEYRGCRFHIIESCKSTVLSAVLAAITGVCVYLLSMLWA